MFFKKQKQPDPPRRRTPVTRLDEARRPQPPPAARGQVFSYHASRSQRQEAFGRVAPDKAQQIQKWQTRLAWLKSVPRVLALLLALGTLGAVLRLDSHAVVVPLDAARGQVFLRSLHTYETAVQRTFSKSLANSNKLTVSTAGISADLKKQFPELKTVAISLPLSGSRPVVHLQPAVPALIMVTRNNGVFVVDASGKALLMANETRELEKLHIPVITDESGLTLKAGDVALPTRSVAFITEVVDQLKAKQITLQSLTLPAETNELQVRIEGKPYYIKYNLHGAAREEAGAYLAARQKLESENKAVQEYIDVRVPGKVYYK